MTRTLVQLTDGAPLVCQADPECGRPAKVPHSICQYHIDTARALKAQQPAPDPDRYPAGLPDPSAHLRAKVTCPECGTAITAANLRRHRKRAHNVDPPPGHPDAVRVCAECGKAGFHNMQALGAHRRQAHGVAGQAPVTRYQRDQKLLAEIVGLAGGGDTSSPVERTATSTAEASTGRGSPDGAPCPAADQTDGRCDIGGNEIPPPDVTPEDTLPCERCGFVGEHPCFGAPPPGGWAPAPAPERPIPESWVDTGAPPAADAVPDYTFPHVCPACALGFSTPADLDRHQRRCHPTGDDLTGEQLDRLLAAVRDLPSREQQIAETLDDLTFLLIDLIPPGGHPWPFEQRERWKTAACAIADLRGVYP